MCCSDMRNNDLEKIYDRPFVSDNSRNRVLLCPGFMVPKQEGSIPLQDETLCPGYQDSISRTEVVHTFLQGFDWSVSLPYVSPWATVCC